jgi:ABC-type transporter Mla subunit MlaD
MDLLDSVNSLEELLNESRPIPMTRTVIMDQERMLEIIEKLRTSIPDEVKHAQQVLMQRDKILAQALEEAGRTVELAKNRADVFASRDTIVQEAQKQAEQILATVRSEAEVTRRTTNQLVVETLVKLRATLDDLLEKVASGIAQYSPEFEPDQSTQDAPQQQ